MTCARDAKAGATGSLRLPIIVRLTSLAMTAGTAFVVALILEPTDLGAYFVAASVAMVLGTMGQFGLGQALIRVVGQWRASGAPEGVGAGAAIRWLLPVLGVLTVLSAGLTVTSHWWGGRWISAGTATARSVDLAIIWGAITALQGHVAETFRADSRVLQSVFFGGLVSGTVCLGLLATIGLSGSGLGLEAVLWAHILSLLVSSLLGIVMLWRQRPGGGPREGLPVTGFARTAFSAWTATGLLMLCKSLDVWLLSAHVAAADIAMYGLAVRVADLVSLPLLMINLSTPPLIAHLSAAGERESLQAQLRDLATVAFRWSLLGSIPALLAGGYVIQHLADGADSPVYWVLAALIAGQLVNVATGSCGLALLMSGHGGSYVWSCGLALLVLLVGGWFASRHFGIVGMSLAAASCQVLMNVGWVVQAWRQLGVKTSARLL